MNRQAPDGITGDLAGEFTLFTGLNVELHLRTRRLPCCFCMNVVCRINASERDVIYLFRRTVEHPLYILRQIGFIYVQIGGYVHRRCIGHDYPCATASSAASLPLTRV